MNKPEMNIVYVGLSGFPFGYAAISRQKLICQGLQRAGASVSIVCSRAVFRDSRMKSRLGEFEGLSYRYVVNPKRSDSFIIRNLLRLSEPWRELICLYKMNRQKKISHLLVSHNNEMMKSIWYFLVSKLIRSKVVFSLVELYEPGYAKSFTAKLNHFFFLRVGLRFYDAFLPISGFIADFFKDVPRPSLLVPIMVDFERVSSVSSSAESIVPRFVFCGAAGYPNTIQFCIQSFELMKHPRAELYIVAGGSDSEVNWVKDLIHQSPKSDRIKHSMNLSEEDLFKLYKSSSALLIPLFNTVKDRARFPHKLGEYLATGRPVISTDGGEIAGYLENGKQGLFAESGNVNQFASCMDYVIENPKEAERIGLEGQIICKSQFSHINLGLLLYDFLKNRCG